jgi:hypothetical protein
MRCGELLREIEPARGAKQNMRWKLADAYLQHFERTTSPGFPILRGSLT